MKTKWERGDKGKIAREAGIGSSYLCDIMHRRKLCPAELAVRLEAACRTYGYNIPRDQWVFVEHRSGNPLFPTRKGGEE